MGSIKLETIPLTGEWRAKDKPWRLEFRADKTVVSSKGASQPDAPQAWTSEPGTYKVDYFGTLWVKLKNGGIYSAVLAPPPGTMAPPSPNRFDLIESETESVTVFNRTYSDKSKASGFPKAAPALIPPTPTRGRFSEQNGCARGTQDFAAARRWHGGLGSAQGSRRPFD